MLRTGAVVASLVKGSGLASAKRPVTGMTFPEKTAARDSDFASALARKVPATQMPFRVRATKPFVLTAAARLDRVDQSVGTDTMRREEAAGIREGADRRRQDGSDENDATGILPQQVDGGLRRHGFLLPSNPDYSSFSLTQSMILQVLRGVQNPAVAHWNHHPY